MEPRKQGSEAQITRRDESETKIALQRHKEKSIEHSRTHLERIFMVILFVRLFAERKCQNDRIQIEMHPSSRRQHKNTYGIFLNPNPSYLSRLPSFRLRFAFRNVVNEI